MSLIKVKEYFKKYGIEDRIFEFEETSATVSEAAKRLGCDEAHIAKTLSFKLDDKVILIVFAGDTKVDNAKYRHFFKTKAKMLSYDEVEPLVGHKVGGVCPFAINDGIDVYLDISLKRFSHVYPACGSTNSAIKLSIEELEKYSNYKEWIDVGKTLENI